MTIDNIVTSAPITIDIADLSQLVLPKNSPNGVVIGKLAATVANTDETPVFSITSQNPAGAIALDGNKMMLADTSAFDYETNTELTGEIQATAGSATATATFMISITDGAGIYIPDAKFKAVLVKNTTLNTNGDQEISVAEAQAYSGEIDEDSLGITDATGIEYFANITSLNLNTNALTALNVSKNTALTRLRLNNNRLTDIDVSNNIALTYLTVGGNNLTDIDVSNNIALTYLTVSGNNLTDIDVSNNTVLTDLYVNDNNLTELDVSQNTALLTLIVGQNSLTALDVSQITALEALLSTDNPKLTCIKVNSLPVPITFQKDAGAKYQTTDCSN